jgi:hypothetical protein
VQSASLPKEPYYSFFIERPNFQVAELTAIDRAFLELLHKMIETSVQMLADGKPRFARILPNLTRASATASSPC